MIELMIVISIISILAAIAIPQYQKYVAKAEAASIVAEVMAVRIFANNALIEGIRKGKITGDDLGLPKKGKHCEFSALGDLHYVNGALYVFCDFTPKSRLNKSGRIILDLKNKATNEWSCHPNMINSDDDPRAEIWPPGCNTPLRR